jgi:hypothetical protein
VDAGARRRHGLLSLSDPLPGSGLLANHERGGHFSRKIVGWGVHACETADLASNLIRQAVLGEACIARPRVLHADNGSPLSCMRSMHCRAVNEGCHDESNDGETGYHGVLQPPARQ